MTPLRLLFSLVLIVSSVSVAQARTVWVDDQLYLPVRSGAGTQYRIIENALPSGTPLEVLETGDMPYAYCIVDGQVQTKVQAGTLIHMQTAPTRFRHLTQSPEQFFDVLVTKFGFAGMARARR